MVVIVVVMLLVLVILFRIRHDDADPFRGPFSRGSWSPIGFGVHVGRYDAPLGPVDHAYRAFL